MFQIPGTRQWQELGRTEIIWDNLNPDFERKFQLEHHFEVHQQFLFSVYDIDCESDDLSKHDFLGQVECSLGQIATHQGRYERKLYHKDGTKFKGSIIIMSEEVIISRDHFNLQFTVSGLTGCFMTKPKHFLEIRRADEDGEFGLVKRTETLKGETISAPVVISGTQLNNGDNHRTLQVELYQYKSNGRHKKLGDIQTTGDELKEYWRRRPVWSIDNTMIELALCKVVQKYTFMDYLTGGMEMAFVVAIDFTASNLNPANPKSLHYNHGTVSNQYVQAIQSVGEIIQDYDTDKMFPVYGFGARLPPKWAQIIHVSL